MARITFSRHRKLRDLGIALKSKALAWGSMEMIWECGCDAGDPVIGNAESVEKVVEWRGKRGAFALAVADAKLMDVSDDGIYTIHDFWDHAPKYVKDRKNREDQRLQRGETLSDQARKAARARWDQKGKTNADGMRLDAQPQCGCNADGMRLHAPPSLALALTPPLTPRPHGASACALENCGSQAPPLELPNCRQPEEPEEPPREAAEFFAAAGRIGAQPGEPEAGQGDRREFLERQRLVLLGGGAR